ncbi:MAG: methyltransferase [Pseudomonadota bacterium]
MIRAIFATGLALALVACGQGGEQSASEVSQAGANPTASKTDVATAEMSAAGGLPLDEILETLPDKDKARIVYRHPKETLDFFGVKPGMTVVDTTPGDIWYAGILASYLGPDGTVIGADRPLSVWEWFGEEYSPPEFLEKQATWPQTWPSEQTAKARPNSAAFSAVAYGSVPSELAGAADVVMMIREMHNIAGSDQTNGVISKVLAEINMLLKPGGVFGVIQHRAPESASDAWANGENGYLKQSTVIALVEAAGFVLEDTSDINANPKDQPTEEDGVWRLPPGLDIEEGNEALRNEMLAIGESNRMTLKFRKPE